MRYDFSDYEVRHLEKYYFDYGMTAKYIKNELNYDVNEKSMVGKKVAPFSGNMKIEYGDLFSWLTPASFESAVKEYLEYENYSKTDITLSSRFIKSLDICNAFKTAMETDGKLTISETILQDFVSYKPYSFSSVSKISEDGKRAIKSVLSGMQDIIKYSLSKDIYLSMRKADILTMSDGIGGSCYHASGLYAHAPLFLSKHPNIFVLYATDKNSGPFGKKISRTWGFSSEEYTFLGRQYRNSFIRFWFSLLLKSKPVNKIEKTYQELFPAFGESYSIKNLAPDKKRAYSDDLNLAECSLYVEDGNELMGWAHLQKDLKSFNGFDDEHGFLHCINCGDEMNSFSQEYSISCCDEGACCDICENRCSSYDLYWLDDYGFSACVDCLNDRFYSCDLCEGCVSHEDSFITQDNNTLCESCFVDLNCCNDCGATFVDEDNLTHVECDNTWYCANCYPREDE